MSKVGLFDTVINIFSSLLNKIPTPAPKEEPDKLDTIEETVNPFDKSIITNSANIIIDKNIRTKYKVGWINHVRKKPITEIVIHGTGGGTTTQGFLKWMYDGERAADYVKGVGLFHFFVGKDGAVVETLDTEYWVWHSTSDGHDENTIGIECLNSSKSNRDPYTDVQYNSLFKLIFEHLVPLYPTINRITSHKYNILKYNSPSVAQKYLKDCPGNGFDWTKLDAVLKKYGYTFSVDGNLRYNIKKL